MIKKIIVKNFRLLKDFELDFNKDINIIVGDNEAGKSTILEAINLALTRRLNGKLLDSELSTHIFHRKTVNAYLDDLSKGSSTSLPEMYIELYFEDDPSLVMLRGSNNSLKEDAAGIRLEVVFNEDYIDEYTELTENPKKVNMLPVEYYKVNWLGFDGNARTQKSLSLKPAFIDATTIRLQSGTDYYLQNIISDGLTAKQRAQLALDYRQLKEEFSKNDSIASINSTLETEGGMVTEKQLSIGIDVSQKAGWESTLVPHLDDIPSQYSGKGEQNSLKILLALKNSHEDSRIVLIEEPENHLSFSSMNKLISKIQEKCDGKQIIIATHSSFILNKLGLNKLILIRGGDKLLLNSLSNDTLNYFMKLPGYDTLRLILAKKAILVEGPSDELVVQKAYLRVHSKLPIADGVDIISVRGLSFKRFLDIAIKLEIPTGVVTDNDGDYRNKIEKKYAVFFGAPTISIHFSKNDKLVTLEDQIVDCNNLSLLNNILSASFGNKEELSAHVRENKTDFALKLFETEESFVIPQYIQDAIA